MSATVLMNGSNMNANLTSQVTGFDANKSLLDLSQASTYTFPEPKEGVISKIWPSDATWHPLSETSYKEITTHIFGIENMQVDANTKKSYIDKVKSIVIESYPRKSMAVVYQGLIVIALLVLVQIIFVGGSSTFLNWCYGIAAVIILGNLAYTYIWAQGSGENYWTTYWSDLSSRIAAGKTPAKILEEYGDEERHQAQLDVMRSMNSNRSTSTFGTVAAGSFFGSMIGNNF
jgi:hypothetical protein